MAKTIYSCVFHDSPKYRVQLGIWLTTLRDLAGVAPENMAVHVVGPAEPEIVRRLHSFGCRYGSIAPFGDGRYCNKVGQLGSDLLQDADFFVLCDTDIAFAAPLSPWLTGDRVRAKPVDAANPPLPILEQLYERAGFSALPARISCTHSDAPTFANNCNGGLYIIPARLHPALAEAWPRWASWVGGHQDLLERWIIHADQLAFGLALHELGETVDSLPPEANYPTHLGALATPNPAAEVCALHYHDRLNAHALLLPVGDGGPVDAAIQRVNTQVARCRGDQFDNREFWDWRYARFPELGSGLGSRGTNQAVKRRILTDLLGASPDRSIIDVGCGDLQVVGEMPFTHYLGIDISPEALRLCRERRPDWRFLSGDICGLTMDTAEVVLCFDVLIHQRTREAYLAMVQRLAELCTGDLIIGAYNQPPWYNSDITFFHEPISATLHRLGGFASLDIVGGYRDTTVILARR